MICELLLFLRLLYTTFVFCKIKEDEGVGYF